jgi:hypothetical protein
MDFTTSEIAAKDPTGTKDKTIISNDAYAVADMLDKLIKQLEVSRITSLM